MYGAYNGCRGWPSFVDSPNFRQLIFLSFVATQSLWMQSLKYPLTEIVALHAARIVGLGISEMAFNISTIFLSLLSRLILKNIYNNLYIN
jgi:hypothetical protein